jgi:hypothetical protein
MLVMRSRAHGFGGKCARALARLGMQLGDFSRVVVRLGRCVFEGKVRVGRAHARA